MKKERLAALALSVAAAAPARAQGPLPPPPVPPGNPITPAKADLGKALFWDEQLSSTRTVACGTCHIPSSGGSDPRSILGVGASAHPGFDGVLGSPDDVVGSPGVVRSAADASLISDGQFGLAPQVTGRKAPTMINAAYAPLLFWDGRAEEAFEDPLSGNLVTPIFSALESQAAGPPLSDVEMAHEGRDWNDVAARIGDSEPLALAASVPPALASWIAGRSYAELFEEAFASPGVTPVRILQAIGTYERTLISDETPFDSGPPGPFGGGPGLSPQEQAGLAIFNGPGNCTICHSGPFLSDHQFHNIGVRPAFEDPGRGGITGFPPDMGAFKTPGLRNVLLRAPYFHDGSKATLMDVVEFYDRGGDFGDNLDPLIQPLGLGPQQKQDLVAFLGTGLLDERVAAELPPFDRPVLYSESARPPALFGTGTAGSGGFVPRQIALEPPLLGNPEFTLGLEHALGASAAVLAVDFASFPPGVPIAGVTAYLGFTPALFLAASVATESTGAGAGWTSVTLSLPESSGLAGVPVFAQWFVVDPGAGSGLSASEAVSVTFF